MKFFEMISNIKLDKKLLELFEDVEIEKIVISRKSDIRFMCVQSPRIISYKNIKMMEEQLQKQLFSSYGYTIKIKPRFILTKQYNPEKLWNVYKDCFIDEIGDTSRQWKIMIEEAKVEFDNDNMVITLYDDFINRHCGQFLSEYFESVYSDRFGFDINVKLNYEIREVPEICDTYIEPAYVAANNSNNDEEHKKEKVEKTDEVKSIPIKEKKEQKKFGAYEKGKFQVKKRLPDDPDIIYGRPFDESNLMKIVDIQDEIGLVVVRGKIIKVDEHETKNGKIIFTFSLTDYTDTIVCKIFSDADEADEVRKNIAVNVYVKVFGAAKYDTFEHDITIGSISGIKKIPSIDTVRTDNAPVKRVELHAHTTMSEMDSVVSATKLVKTAFEWGHKSIAITDHGVVHAFTEANHALNPKDYASDPEKQQRAKDFKIIYGVEAYLVDDIKNIVENDKGQVLNTEYVVFDIETTGVSIKNDKITEIGAVRICNGEITDRYNSLCNPEIPIPFEITKLTGITDDMVINEPIIDKLLPEFLEFSKNAVLVAHNAGFDVGFMEREAERLGYDFDFTIMDTLELSRVLLTGLNNYRLNTVAKHFNISLENHHRAVDDAECAANILLKLIEIMTVSDIKLDSEEDNIRTIKVEHLSEINEIGSASINAIKKMQTYHAIILCKNNTGRVNLYRLISKSHIDYYNKRPRIPKSEYIKYSEGLIIGSACEAGELYRAVATDRPENEIIRLAKFYDYFEIQPVGNNMFMIEDKEFSVSSIEDIQELNKRIVKLGIEYNKPVVATCDVHFLNPEDEIYRRIIMAGKGFKDADNQAPLYYRTTDEMLKEFEYLGKDKAYEVVVTNTNLICDMIEKISPVRPDKCPPVIPDSDKTLREICYNTAHSMYGEELPEIVAKRLEHELNSIIKNGFAVMYIIAQKLVWKSNEDGYLVGSRGSVGSSFVATMAGITEVNPLPPHYYCKKCHYSDFDSEIVKANAANSGFDLPDAICPVCGEKLAKDGHDIPFETFLGFNGDKEPDIDLNFSGDYQSKAHDYTEVIFGKGHTFRAGTIGTLAEKTAYGYVYKYYEERGIHKRRVEMERIAMGCDGVRRTTGQHPGGIIVLPHGEEIYSFTPVQRPANDMTTNTITTHFDYHSIDHNLLKLDILGHDDPTMIRMLQDITGIDAKTIPMDDKKVMSLFESTDALGITPADIDGCELGSIGLPELGTDFVMQMLRDTKPRTFSDMIRISGLSHGTNVWLNNNQLLIAEGKCTLSSAICTRDDIMTYLINKKLDSGLSFKIMESVRKGKGLTPEYEEEMLKHDVPDWYIWSCKQIKYMFPKAHACAYIMMAIRIAYFKVYYPLAYYVAYFSIRATSIDYAIMCRGQAILEQNIKEFKQRAASNDPSLKLSDKEDNMLKDMKSVQEMYARGYDFTPIDIFKADAKNFKVVGDKIMPSLSSIGGLGINAAEQIVKAASEGDFLSRDDFKNRSKVSASIVEELNRLGLLGDIPESDQMSFMDLFK